MHSGRLNLAGDYQPGVCRIAAAILGAGALGAGSSLIGSSMQSGAASRALNLQSSMFQTGKDALQPFIQGGTDALTTLKGLLTPGPNQTSILSSLPGFQFAQDWGGKAIQNLGTMRGMGGNVIKSGVDYATGLAQTGFGGLAGLLQNLVNTGAGGASSLLGGANQAGSTMGGTLQSLGTAQASGVLGASNALGGSLNSMGNLAFLKSILGGGGAGSGNPGMFGNMTSEGITGIGPFASVPIP